MSEYSEKFKDPRWQKKRLEIFERDGWRCVGCGNDKETLHVHHKWYDQKEPWEYPDKCLVTLCEHCHQMEHSTMPHYLRVLEQTILGKGLLAHDILEFASSIYDMTEDEIRSMAGAHFRKRTD